MKKACFSLILVTMLILSACAAAISTDTAEPITADQAATIAVGTMQALPPAPTATPSFVEGSIVVSFTRDGSVYIWDSTTQSNSPVFNASDVTLVTISDDAQRIAFLRRWRDSNQCDQTALWVVEQDGENAREILSPAELRESLSAMECQSPPVSIPKIEWLPASHRLVYSLISDHEHASPQGLYLADADTLETKTLVQADHSFHFVPSPDGQQVALLSTSGLSFINVDGSNWRQDVVKYPVSGRPLPGFGNGVWTMDSRAFVLATYGDNGLNITRVPVDGAQWELP